MKIKAYAKLNLFFDIENLREDGYHNVLSVNQSIDLADIIDIELSNEINITCSQNNTTIPTDKRNTCYKAVEQFCDYTNIKTGATIHITKNIPSEAGLGGASADAAAVISGLNYLTKSNLCKKSLIEISAKVGADVPFCLVGGTAFCGGIGEKIIPLAPLCNCEFIIIKPAFGVSTKTAFQRYDSKYLSSSTQEQTKIKKSKEKLDFFLENLKTNNLQKIGDNFYNILEEVSDLKELNRIKNYLINAGAKGVLMTGSGSCIYGIVDPGAKNIMQKIEKSFPQVYLCKPTKNSIVI